MATSPQPFKLFGATIPIPSSPSPKPTDAAPKPSGLVCPRCKSRETKFCYFNNYNVNQPRHFCRACHRYWTAGGALRNVPVGAGRRKHRPTPDPALVQHWLLAHDNAAAAAAFRDPIR